MGRGEKKRKGIRSPLETTQIEKISETIQFVFLLFKLFFYFFEATLLIVHQLFCFFGCFVVVTFFVLFFLFFLFFDQ